MILHSKHPSSAVSDTRVSVLVPAYKPKDIAEALESVLAQTYPVHEIIIGDDCPDDGVYQSIAHLLKTNKHIHYIRNTPSLGPAANYLSLAEKASSQWIKFMDDDDILYPEAIARMMDHAQKHDNVSLVISAMADFSDKSPGRTENRCELSEFTSGTRFFIQKYQKNPLTLFTRMLLRRDVTEAVGQMDIPARMISLDELLGLMACLLGNIVYVDEVLCEHRIQASGYSRKYDINVFCDDLEYILTPYRYARAKNLFSDKKLTAWKRTMLGRSGKQTLYTLVSRCDMDKARIFQEHLFRLDKHVARKVSFTPKILVKKLWMIRAGKGE
jgi:glycosyltransferase involved in cell wall biosynthesis